MTGPTLISIQVGLPKTRGKTGPSKPGEGAWHSAIFKEPVEGPRWLGRTNLQGDGQADLKHHGGEDKAVLAYAAAHYPLWREELGISDFPHGAFGENFTVEGLDEASVCIGDIYSLGSVRVQVSQPRVPCWKLARRWNIKDLTAQVQRNGRTGWYLRVLEEGAVEAGMPVVLLDRPYPEWTITHAAATLSGLNGPEAMEALSECPLLAESWRNALRSRLAARAGSAG